MEELGICCDHYIWTIKGGVVTKVPVRDSRGRPAPVIRTLQDVYKSEDARRERMHGNVKLEAQCILRADRKLHESVECLSDDVDFIDMDDDITLKQLKKRSLLKKRKRVHGHQNTERAPVYEKPFEDQPDLDEPLINLKLKAPKRSRARRKFDRCDQSSCSKVTTPIVTQPEDNFVPEDYLQVSGSIAPVRVKVEAYEAEKRDCSTTPLDCIPTTFSDVSPLGYDEGPNGSEPIVQCVEEYGDCVTNEISCDHLDTEPILVRTPRNGVDVKFEALEWEDQDILDLHPLAIKYGEKTSEASYCKRSHINDILAIESGEETLEVRSSKSSHLDGDLDIEPILMPDNHELHPLAIEFGEEASEVLSCKTSHPDNLLPTEFGEETTKVHSCIGSQLNNHDPHFCSNSGISCTVADQSSKSEVQVPDMTTNGLPDEQEQSLSSHDPVCEPSCDFSISMKIDDTSVVVEDITTDVEQASSCTRDGTKSSGLNYQSSHMKDEFLGSGAKLTSASPNIGAKTVSSPEPCPHPEKLLSKRKLISPCSREQLRLALNSEGQCNDIDQYKCKEKLFEKETGKKTSPLKSDTLPGKVIINNGCQGQFIQRNGIRHAIKKPNVKGNYDGLRSRAYPNISSSRNSIEGCSASAIEFSQRQLHYMENVADKLMKELKFMKGIVEEKLLFQAYRNVSLKNDADEVRSAIKSASKVEEVAKKWLTHMSRDCNRFCKIMKMTPPTSVAAKDTVHSGEKRISFADEAGGELCQVKLLEEAESSQMSDVVKQDG